MNKKILDFREKFATLDNGKLSPEVYADKKALESWLQKALKEEYERGYKDGVISLDVTNYIINKNKATLSKEGRNK